MKEREGEEEEEEEEEGETVHVKLGGVDQEGGEVMGWPPAPVMCTAEEGGRPS